MSAMRAFLLVGGASALQERTGMPADNAASTGALNATGSMIETAIPSTLAAMAVFIWLTMSATILFAEPVHWYLHPTRAQASEAPDWVGTKNGLVVTWLTNTKFHVGWLRKLPSPEGVVDDGLLVPPHASSKAGKERPVAPSTPAWSRSRRLNRKRGKPDKMLDSSIGNTSQLYNLLGNPKNPPRRSIPVTL